MTLIGALSFIAKPLNKDFTRTALLTTILHRGFTTLTLFHLLVGKEKSNGKSKCDVNTITNS